MAFSLESEFENEDNLEEDPKEFYGIRDGVLFVIDATPSMFKNDPEEGVPYFLQCIRQYKEILKQKLVWNRQDWMGLILFGTKKWDTDSEVKHIWTLQKLNLVSVDNLKEIMRIDEEGEWKYYRDIASSTAYPLHDVLWHAARAFSSIDITMPMRRVILFTCQDDPPMTDDNQKHQIRVKATSYSDIGLHLSIVGLGKNWNHDLFYKDLEILSEKIDTDDYKRTSLKDLLQQVKLPSRNMAKLPWRLGENVIVDVSIRTLSAKTQYLKKECISKETNVPLISNTYLSMIHGSDNEKEADVEKDKRPSTLVLETEIQKYQEFGGKKICFAPTEVRSLSVIREPGIDLICIKPIFYHPLYHFGAPYFVTVGKSNRKDNKLLFGALVHKCDSRNLMIICAVTMRKHSAPSLYTMIPTAEKGGFYLYKIPYKENVRKLGERSSEYMYNNNKKKPPVDPIATELLGKMIKKLRIQYDPKLFSNPKLQVQLQTVETLALDLEKSESPPDDTLPQIDEMHKLVKNPLDEYHKTFKEVEFVSDAPPKKKSKKDSETLIEPSTFEDKEAIRKLIVEKKIDSVTIPQLKTMLKTLDLKTSGKKEELINRIKEWHAKEVIGSKKDK